MRFSYTLRIVFVFIWNSIHILRRSSIGFLFARFTALQPRKDRVLRITFTSNVNASLPWSFRPLQSDILVHPGETALAFYAAKNNSSIPIVGISTYNILPFEAGMYFNKIQCFCFEEQLLNPGEEVDMPVFFYIDPEFDDDPGLEHVKELILHYTFFESKGFKMPAHLTPMKEAHSYQTLALSKVDGDAKQTKAEPKPVATVTLGISDDVDKRTKGTEPQPLLLKH